jgi:hypothetical protein
LRRGITYSFLARSARLPPEKMATPEDLVVK